MIVRYRIRVYCLLIQYVYVSVAINVIYYKRRRAKRRRRAKQQQEPMQPLLPVSLA